MKSTVVTQLTPRIVEDYLPTGEQHGRRIIINLSNPVSHEFVRCIVQVLSGGFTPGGLYIYQVFVQIGEVKQLWFLTLKLIAETVGYKATLTLQEQSASIS